MTDVDVNIYEMTDTWNNATTTFTAIEMNVTDTASADASLLFDLQVAGASKFSVDKNGSMEFAGKFIGTNDISPAELTANTDDWAPDGISTAYRIRISTDASRNLTGITGGADGRELTLHNHGTNNLVLKHEDSGSAATNRFELPGGNDFTLQNEEGVNIYYDAVESRWHIVAQAPGSGSGDVTVSGTPANNQLAVWVGSSSIEGDADLTWDESDFTLREAVNDGNPQVRLGATDAEELHIQTVYDSGAQTLDYVLFQTDVASATANKGLFRFNVDGTDILDIDDGGLSISSGLGFDFDNGDITLTHAANELLMAGDGAVELDIRGPAGTGTATAGLLTLSTAETSVVDGDQLGRIDFQAPLEAGGGDAALVAASIWAEADAAFSATVNDAELVFATAASEVAGAMMRLSTAALFPHTDDGLALGITSTNEWSDLFLASGAVINFDNSDMTLTHSANFLTIAGGQFLIPDGSAAAPGLSFAGESGANTGFFLQGENAIGFASNGSEIVRMNTTGFVQQSGVFRMTGSTTESAPALVFGADLDSGLFDPAGNTIALSTGGTEAIRWTSSQHTTLAAQLNLASFTVAGVPSAATAGGFIYVSDETGGAVPAFSDGTNWRRVTDRAIVS